MSKICVTKYLSNFFSRRKCSELYKEGKIRIKDEKIKGLYIDKDQLMNLRVDGRLINSTKVGQSNQPSLYLCYKKRHLLMTDSDEHDRKSFLQDLFISNTHLFFDNKIIPSQFKKFLDQSNSTKSLSTLHKEAFDMWRKSPLPEKRKLFTIGKLDYSGIFT